jgi:hypothetical protein
MRFTNNKITDNIDNGVMFSRYLTTQKFLNFLLYKQIPFTRLDKFDDLTEGMSNAQLQDLDVAISKAKANNPIFSDLDSLIKEGITSIKNIEAEALSIQKGHYVSCWFCSDRESSAMWDIYANKDGIMLQVEAAKFFNFIKQFVINLDNDDYVEFAYGFIDYSKLVPYDYYQTLPDNKFRAFKKDLCYEHEKEFRFVAVRNPNKKDGNLVSYNINIEEIINQFKIICHPKMENWKKNNLKKLIETLGYNIRVEDSNIRTK